MMARLAKSVKAFMASVLPGLLVLLSLSLGLAGTAEARIDDGNSYSVQTRPPTSSNYGHQPPGSPPGDETTGAYSFFSAENVTGEHKNIALQRICDEGYFTERVVHCVRTIIDGAVQNFLDDFQLALNGYIIAMVTLAVTLFGGKILIGSVEQPGKEAFTLLLKIGAVMLFTNSLGGFLPHIFPVMESLAGYAMSSIGSEGSSSFLQSCSADNGFESIWAKVDCILQRLFTGDDDAANPSYRVGVLWVLAVAIFWTSFLGIFVFAMMCGVFLMILLLVIRCVYVFLAAYAFLAMLTIVSPLIIPLALFPRTAIYFQKWWKQFLSMIIQPMILFGYMAFVFALIDSMFFQDNPYSLARILGANWEEPQVTKGMSDSDIDAIMDQFKDDTGFSEDDEEYKGHKRMLQEAVTYRGIGIAQLKEERLIDIEINAAQDIVKATHVGDVPVVGGVIEDGANVGAKVVDTVANWALDKLEDWLIPFKVTRIAPEGRTRWDFMMDILKFFIVVLVFMPLLVNFTKNLPRLVQKLSSAIRTPGSMMPLEKQAIGTIGAVKGATVGAVKGAAVGFVTGGKAGAIKGAVDGGARGAVGGYRGAVGKHAQGRNSSHEEGGSMAKSEGTQRKLLHGEAGGKAGGFIKGAGKEAAMQALTRGAGKGVKGIKGGK